MDEIAKPVTSSKEVRDWLLVFLAFVRHKLNFKTGYGTSK